MATTNVESDFLVDITDGPNFEVLKNSLGFISVKFTIEYTHRPLLEKKLNGGKPVSFHVKVIEIMAIDDLVSLRAESVIGQMRLNLAVYNTKTRTGAGFLR